MKPWIIRAVKLFPYLKDDLEASVSPFDMWGDLFYFFKYYIEKREFKEARKIGDFAKWCTSNYSPNNLEEPHQAALTGFYECIGFNDNLWPHLNKVLSTQDFESEFGTISYMVDAGKVPKLKDAFYSR